MFTKPLRRSFLGRYGVLLKEWHQQQVRLGNSYMVPGKIWEAKSWPEVGKPHTSVFVLTKRRGRSATTLTEVTNIASYVFGAWPSNPTKTGTLNFATKTCIHQHLTD